MIFNIFIILADPSGRDDSVRVTKLREMLKILFKLCKTHRKRTFPAGRNSPDHLGWPIRRGRVSQFHEMFENHEKL